MWGGAGGHGGAETGEFLVVGADPEACGGDVVPALEAELPRREQSAGTDAEDEDEEDEFREQGEALASAGWEEEDHALADVVGVVDSGLVEGDDFGLAADGAEFALGDASEGIALFDGVASGLG